MNALAARMQSWPALLAAATQVAWILFPLPAFAQNAATQPAPTVANPLRPESTSTTPGTILTPAPAAGPAEHPPALVAPTTSAAPPAADSASRGGQNSAAASPPESSVANGASVAPSEASSASEKAAAEEAGPAAGERITAAEIEARRKQAEDAKGLGDDVKKKIADLYRLAAEHLAQAEQQAAQAAQWKAGVENLPASVAQLRRELETLQDAQPQPPLDGPLSQLEQQLSAADLQLKELKAAQAKLETEPAARAARRKELRGLLTSAPQRREELSQQLQAAPPADEPPLLSLARRTEMLARKALLEEQMPALRAELAKYDAEEASDLLRLQRDILARKVALSQTEFELINEAVHRRRESDARDAVRQAQEELINAHPALKSHAEENHRLAEEAQALAKKIGQTEASLKKAQTRLEEIQKQMAQTQTKVENVGLTGPIGLMLRKQRAELPDVRSRRENVHLREGEIDAAQLALYEYDDQRSDLSTPEPFIADIVVTAEPLSDAQHRRLREAAEQVLARKREYLDALIRNYGGYFDSLVELDTTERQLINVTEEYQNYIDERVLWIRSARPLHTDFRPDESDYQLVSAAAWREVGAGLLDDVKQNFLVYLLAGLIFATLLGFNLRLRRDISRQGQLAERSTCRDFLPTFRTALMTQILVVPWPALMLFFAWRLAPLAGREGLSQGLFNGLTATALTYFLLRLTRELCRPGGLGEAHFGWPVRATRQMRAGLRMLGIFGLPLIGLAATLRGLDPEHGRDVIERCALIVMSALLMVFVSRQFSPTSGVAREMLAANPGGWLARTRHVWYGAMLAAPALLAGLSLLGYHYTARQLAARLYITATLILLAVVVRSLLLRSVLIARRKLAMAEWRRRRAEQWQSAQQYSAQASSAQATSAQGNPAPSATSPDGSAVSNAQQIATEEPQADLKTHSAQIEKLVGTGLVAALLVGLWCIWSDVVPALGFLDRFALWTTTVAVTEQVAGAGEGVVSTAERIMTVTLADVGLAILITVVTFVAAKNVPGLLEISVLRRLPLENSVRYAITTLASYAIVLIGVIVGCNTIGLRWSQIQWLATALTFGLAFGLQEMFANFVAGLIILFERPVRVGDVVTVDDTTGVVSRIRIRATTITNWDRKEYIVPNKEFITGKLLNWTLSDQVNRISINVGVAYGSNTKLTHELLLKCAADHPLILDKPPTMATFEGFGDNSLNFCLRTFLPSMEDRLAVIHDLHMAIDEAFRKAGIEISFPQRDLHIRSLSPEIAALARDAAAADDSQGAKDKRDAA